MLRWILEPRRPDPRTREPRAPGLAPAASPALVLFLTLNLAACGADSDAPPTDAPQGRLELTATSVEVPTDALLQAISPVSEEVVWISGHQGTWLRTENGGASWQTESAPAGDTLEFRDVAAFGPRTAYLMSAGLGARSRIYRTDDGGESWTRQYIATDPSEFLSCMAFWDEDTGVVYGDEFDGSLYLLRTSDGGANWDRIPPESLPASQEGEGGFAASGTCIIAGESGRGWIATGNAERPRVLMTEDRGLTWSAVDAPVVGGTMAGLFTVDVRGETGVALGGAVGADTARGRYVAISSDGGRSWEEGGALAKTGAVYGAVLAPGLDAPVVVAVGPGGIDWSTDGGRTWESADDRTHWAVAFSAPGVGWATGPEGRVTRITIQRVADGEG
ncbi:MAG: YCF48-related protein [Gemmatimonadota bacterium]